MTTPVPTRPYVLVHAGGRTWQASGQLHRTRLLADVPAPAPAGGLPVVSMVPYCQIRERGYAVHDGGEEILTLVPDEVVDIDPESLRLPGGADSPLTPGPLELTSSDEEYAAIVEAVIRDEICRGEGANFLISRQGRVQVGPVDDAAMRDLFARLVAADGEVTMSPICGTLPKKALTRRADLIEFITDPKEINELFQVVDEELKMMSRLCSAGGTVVGPYLQEMAALVHTAYDLTGRSELAPIDIFRDSMFPATMIGRSLY